MAEFLRKFQRFLQQSIFVKLFLIFLATALTLVVVIRGFFFIAFDQGHVFKQDLFRNLIKYSWQLVEEIGSPPDPERAEALAKELGLQFRVSTPEGEWTTDPSLPPLSFLSVDERLSNPLAQVGRYRRHPFVVIDRNGARFAVFFLHRPFRELPAWSFALLGGLVVLILSGSYLMVRRLLRPVDWLTEGVGEITKGNFHHQVPSRSADELARLTKAFNRMAHQIRDRLRARDQLLLDVSHELRSPVTRMKVAVEFVQDESIREKIQREIHQLEAMVTELLESERLNSDHGGLVLEEFDLMPLVRDLANRYAGQESGVRIVSSHGSVPLVLDRDRVLIALRNVFENALKHSCPESGPVEVRVEADSAFVRVLVTDHGPGIPPEDQELVFEPFYRVDKSRTRETGGYGLGLSLAKKIMNAHGGDVVLTSEPNRGSTFTMNFPRA